MPWLRDQADRLFFSNPFWLQSCFTMICESVPSGFVNNHVCSKLWDNLLALLMLINIHTNKEIISWNSNIRHFLNNTHWTSFYRFNTTLSPTGNQGRASSVLKTKGPFRSWSVSILVLWKLRYFFFITYVSFKSFSIISLTYNKIEHLKLIVIIIFVWSDMI